MKFKAIRKANILLTTAVLHQGLEKEVQLSIYLFG